MVTIWPISISLNLYVGGVPPFIDPYFAKENLSSTFHCQINQPYLSYKRANFNHYSQEDGIYP
jgi:hypothetical protein